MNREYCPDPGHHRQRNCSLKFRTPIRFSHGKALVLLTPQKSVFFLGKIFTESGLRREYTVQKAFHGTIKHYSESFDIFRLLGNERLSFLLTYMQSGE